MTTIYNPVVTAELFKMAREVPDHPWFESGAPPVVLGVGRLARQKDFPTLLQAFARLRSERPVRLMILGQANNQRTTVERQAELRALAGKLGVADEVALPGFVHNPYAYMAHAAVFVLSSRFEGLPTVLIEALACGLPVVSTDCPNGPAEILENGKYGALVPVGDAFALAKAISATLDAPPDRGQLRTRALVFTVDQAVEKYEKVLFPNA
jgi:glycosyltransferase involved in cell wall biosynthesis